MWELLGMIQGSFKGLVVVDCARLGNRGLALGLDALKDSIVRRVKLYGCGSHARLSAPWTSAHIFIEVATQGKEERHWKEICCQGGSLAMHLFWRLYRI